MGGESIKPIRKRIHVYFLMTAYVNVSYHIQMLRINYQKWYEYDRAIADNSHNF